MAPIKPKVIKDYNKLEKDLQEQIKRRICGSPHPFFR